MWQVVKRDVRFWIGTTFLSVLMIVSIGYTLFFDGNIRELTMMYNEKGELEAAPFAPSSKFWFGSDVKGRDLVQLIIEGAKWTVGASIIIAILRVIVGGGIGLLLGMYGKRSFPVISSFFDPFSIVPMVMISYFMLNEVLTFDSGAEVVPLYLRVAFQIIVLVCLAVPTVMLYVAQEVKRIKKEEFMLAATVLGGSKWQRLKRHIWPHMLPSFLLLVAQQFVSVLLLLLHLGLLKLFFGGTILFGLDADSVTKEWTGLIGQNFRHLTTHTWIVLIPIAFYSMTILAGNLVSNSMQDAIKLGNVRMPRSKDKEVKEEKQVQSTVNDFSFYRDIQK
ncbi:MULTISPECIES: ABC transporter permease subunit [Bacillus]|jgi:peptide/nickel transport system permease protein|uniref:Oligopeptide ABC transporter, permease protein VC1093 [imported], putative n=2 Tax=Bacillus cereus group TaxID=86661 RepID=Q738H0_BACC1|nr:MULTISPECIES: ABC transporter permease subunit [Bacillus]AAS41342.1 oligopeptide ABC transporter, permease protein VC1093 [imported], putative [Bacillus cereus ATCC 10987]KMQ28064.1 peptide ABC transporter permease [Bacillus cereus]KXY74346.1 peptide ABC transporter permease [Bacillus cereus]MCU5157673.1 ABC transporter permease subunit [Bacillus pacificus]MCU9940580.1 ABC transporter permease subunit [Bacillus pacificus]